MADRTAFDDWREIMRRIAHAVIEHGGSPGQVEAIVITLPAQVFDKIAAGPAGMLHRYGWRTAVGFATINGIRIERGPHA